MASKKQREGIQTVSTLLDQLRQLSSGEGPVNRADPIQGNSDVLAAQWRRERNDLALDGYEISTRLRRIAMLLDENLATLCAQLGLKHNELMLLLALRRVGKPYCLRPTDILKMHSVTSGTVTYRIEQLIKQDLAERVPDESDLRGYLIRLTERGLAVVDRAVTVSSEHANLILGDVLKIPAAGALFIELLRAYEHQIETTSLPSQKPLRKLGRQRKESPG